MTLTADPIVIGISSCLLGETVRFDGTHKLNRFIKDTVGEFVEFVPVCPEVESGMSVPRESVRLVQPKGKSLQMVGPKSGSNYTASMKKSSRSRVQELADRRLCGYILKKGSPSCGMERVRIYPRPDGGAPRYDGRGLFATELIKKLPNLPVEEDGRLCDPHLRENFFVRVFAYRRLRDLFRPRWTLNELVQFHSREKLLLLAHDRPGYRDLGRLVAAAKSVPRRQLRQDYSTLFLSALSKRGTRRKHTNVLQHIAGYFKKLVTAEDRQEIQEVVESYRLSLVPLIVPIVLLRHHVRHHQVEYLLQQSYLSPHPKELMLLNKI